MSEAGDNVVQHRAETDFVHRALGVVGNSLMFTGGALLDLVAISAMSEAVPEGNVTKATLAVGACVLGSGTCGLVIRGLRPNRPSPIFYEEPNVHEEQPDFSVMSIAEQKAWIIANPPGARSRKTD